MRRGLGARVCHPGCWEEFGDTARRPATAALRASQPAVDFSLTRHRGSGAHRVLCASLAPLRRMPDTALRGRRD